MKLSLQMFNKIQMMIIIMKSVSFKQPYIAIEIEKRRACNRFVQNPNPFLI